MNSSVLFLVLFGSHGFYCKSTKDASFGLDSRNNQERYTEYLRRYGYLRTDAHTFPHSVSNAVARFQKLAHIPMTGHINKETLKMINRKRCGVRDIFQANWASHRTKRYIIGETRWHYTDLTYCVESYPTSPYTSNPEVDRTLARAFRMWGDVSTLTFTQRRHCDVDIVVTFKSRYHGDPTPFDGPGEILAHAYFPGDNGRGLHGDLHFDNDEPWTTRGNLAEKEDIFCVAVHEIGHSLGLKHSDVKGAIMWPWARTCTTGGSPLTPDDVRGIQAMYGPPPTTPRRRSWRRSNPSTSAPVGSGCDGQIDSVSIGADGKMYGFKDNLVYQFDRRGVVNGFPRGISSVFPQGPRTVDSSVTLTLSVEPGRKDTVTYLFSGSSTYVYKYNYGSFRLYKGPVPIREELDLPTSTVDSSFFLHDKRTCYFTKGSSYWKLTIDGQGQKTVSPARPLSSLKVIRGIPNFRTAVRMPNGILYFFLNTSFFRLESAGRMRRLVGPLDSAYWWFRCRHRKPQNVLSS